MENKDCHCDEFEELRGASVNNYISTFLKPGEEENRFVCKVCGTVWEKLTTEDSTKPVLQKINKKKE